MLSMLRPPRGGRVLEIGCGRGVALPVLADLLAPSALVGVDLDPVLIAVANQRVRTTQISARVMEGDARALPLDSGSFDLVIDFGTCYHMSGGADGARAALREVVRVLRPGGLFIHETPVAQHLAHPVRSFGRRLPWKTAPELRPYRRAVLWSMRRKHNRTMRPTRSRLAGAMAVAALDRPRALRIFARATILMGFAASTVVAAGAWQEGASGPRVLYVDLDPVDLPARATHHAIAQPRARLVAVPVSGWLRGFSVVLTDANGEPVGGSVLHHVKILAPARRELFLEKMQRVGSAGAETEPILLPRMLGYPVRLGDTLLVNAMLDNVDGEAIRGVRFRVALRYTPAGAWPRPAAIQPFYMSVVPPGPSTSYDLPPGWSVRSWEGQPAVSGRLLAVGGHLHRYARTLRLEDATTGVTIWEAALEMNAAGDVERVPSARFIWRFGVPMRRDHVYRVSAIYDNTTGDTIRAGGMGVLGGVFLPTRGERWPKPDGSSPVYMADLAKQLAGGPDEASAAEMGHAHGAHHPASTHEQRR